MAFACRMYLNSGFNRSNSPDSPALLEQCAYVDGAALDIFQGGRLSTIRVRATETIAERVDYIRLTDTSTGKAWYYAAAYAYMAATDVAVFALALAGVLTAGGVSALSILDGLTERVHVSEDNYGEYDGDDELMTPAEPLQLVFEKAGFDDGSSWNTVVETTVNAFVTERALTGGTFTYTDPTGTEYTVDVPIVAYNEAQTAYNAISKDIAAGPGTCCYSIGGSSGVADALAKSLAFLRSINMEQAVIHQVALPTGYVDITSGTKDSVYVYSEDYSSTQAGTAINYAYLTTLTGKTGYKNTGDISTDFNYSPYDVKNNKVNYSTILKYGIVSASGERGEFNPADIYVSNLSAPNIKYVVDPHTDGKPYFRFYTVNGDSSDTGFLRNSIAGMSWKDVPLIYNRPSGTALNTLKFQNVINTSLVNYNWSQGRNIASGASGAAGALFDSDEDADALISNIQAGGGVELASPYTTIAGMANAGVNAGANYAAAMQARQALVKSELSNLVVANTLQVPTINFPYNSELIRDVYGNDAFIYRYKYSDNDAARIDKLLTMYGYKYTKPLEQSDFTNRQYFNFIKANNVSVTGNPAWLNNVIADELSSGVRFWHVLPNNSYYSENPIVTAEEA